jgi:hypothetical protein
MMSEHRTRKLLVIVGNVGLLLSLCSVFSWEKPQVSNVSEDGEDQIGF